MLHKLFVPSVTVWSVLVQHEFQVARGKPSYLLCIEQAEIERDGKKWAQNTEQEWKNEREKEWPQVLSWFGLLSTASILSALLESNVSWEREQLRKMYQGSV